MKQELLPGDGDLETVEQPMPAKIVVEVLGGDTVAPHPVFHTAVVSMDVLHMPDATAAMAVVPRDEAARFNAEVRGHDGMAGIAVGAQHGAGTEGWVGAIVRDEAGESASLLVAEDDGRVSKHGIDWNSTNHYSGRIW